MLHRSRQDTEGRCAEAHVAAEGFAHAGGPSPCNLNINYIYIYIYYDLQSQPVETASVPGMLLKLGVQLSLDHEFQ